MLIQAFLTSIALSVLTGFTLFVSYINTNSFLRPLSKEDELHYLQILNQTNTSPNSIEETIAFEHARNKVIEHNFRLVAYVLKRYEFDPQIKEDLFSIGIIALIKAINTFKLDKGAKLSTYAIICIRNDINMYFRDSNKRQGEAFIYDSIAQDSDGSDLCIIDTYEPPNEKKIDDQIVDAEEQRILLEDVDRLPILERQVLFMRYGLKNSTKHSQQEIADKLKISRSYVSRIEKKAIQILKRTLGELYHHNES
ncbi:MAG TPA: RNA polymerase subunit sigma-70 [Desulfosporosinus sp.]|nr:RNA polymerase subunit sigma-70 [Desulfosporosinus sp.]